MTTPDLQSLASVLRVRARRSARNVKSQSTEAAERRGVDVAGASDRAGEYLAQVSGNVERVVDGFGSSATGEAYVRGHQELGERLSGLPVITAPRDFIHSATDLTQHVEALERDPESLKDLVWAATAARRADAMLGGYRKFRLVNAGVNLLGGNLAPAAAQLSIGLANRMSDERTPPHQTLLYMAFSGAIRRVQADPTDSEAHYWLSRVYLLTDRYEDATMAARIGARTALSATHRGDCLVALGIAMHALGRPDDARRAAELAIAADVTTGHLVVAQDILVREEMSVLAHAAAVSEAKRPVDVADLERFYGPKGSISRAGRQLVQMQRAKGKEAIESGRRLVGDKKNDLMNKFGGKHG